MQLMTFGTHPESKLVCSTMHSSGGKSMISRMLRLEFCLVFSTMGGASS
jgi:hypothetical protein